MLYSWDLDLAVHLENTTFERITLYMFVKLKEMKSAGQEELKHDKYTGQGDRGQRDC
jgi:hypothetical protein